MANRVVLTHTTPVVLFAHGFEAISENLAREGFDCTSLVDPSQCGVRFPEYLHALAFTTLGVRSRRLS